MTSFIKALAESPAGLNSIPSNYVYSKISNEPITLFDPDPDNSIPIVDFNSLTTGTPDERSKAIRHLGKACQDWGFFMLVNHGVPESLIKAVIEACNGFFNLREDEKRVFHGKAVMDPIRCGTSFNASVEKVSFWRDFLKAFVHPKFHFPDKPNGFSEVAKEYCERTEKLSRELLRAISESLGLEESYIDKAANLEEGMQIFIANLYPPCPQPELAMGMPPHSDHDLLTILIQNGVGGLQVQHNGKWVSVNPIAHSLLINTGDQLEILSNGKYKSVMHRAALNHKTTRISVAIAHGPSLKAALGPAMELIDSGSNPAAYVAMKYKDYLEFQQSNRLDGKSSLDRLRIQPE